MKSVAVALLVVAATACSNASPPQAAPSRSPSPSPSSSPTPTPQERYRQTVLADAPAGFWELADVGGARPGDALADSSPHVRDAVLTDGAVAATPGPLGSRAARFTGKGRVLTPLVDTLRPGRPFTLEFFFRPDDCTRQWTQVVGTAAYTSRGRQGVNVLHYPRFFPSGCRLAVEFWHDDRYTGGCGPPAVVSTGAWVHFAVSYDGRVARCFVSGRSVGQSAVRGFGAPPGEAFGIGGSGSGYAGTLDSGSLAAVAVYERALPAAVLVRHAAASR